MPAAAAPNVCPCHGVVSAERALNPWSRLRLSGIEDGTRTSDTSIWCDLRLFVSKINWPDKSAGHRVRVQVPLGHEPSGHDAMLRLSAGRAEARRSPNLETRVRDILTIEMSADARVLRHALCVRSSCSAPPA